MVGPSEIHTPHRERFYASVTWLILRNVLGWLLILSSFVAGPLVPGPGGIPLFLAGFALASFPGKRRLTARALRGRPVRLRPVLYWPISAAAALLIPALALRAGPAWLRTLADPYAAGNGGLAVVYAAGVALVGLMAALVPAALNVLVRMISRARRRFRPWLRRHHIRLLPPRWRVRHPHEAGAGPLRLKDEILKLVHRKGSVRPKKPG